MTNKYKILDTIALIASISTLVLYVLGLLVIDGVNHDVEAYITVFVGGVLLWWVHAFDIKKNGLRSRMPVLYSNIPKDMVLLGMFGWIGIIITLGIIFAFDFHLMNITLMFAYIGTSIIAIRCFILFLPNGVLVLKKKYK